MRYAHSSGLHFLRMYIWCLECADVLWWVYYYDTYNIIIIASSHLATDIIASLIDLLNMKLIDIHAYTIMTMLMSHAMKVLAQLINILPALLLSVHVSSCFTPSRLQHCAPRTATTCRRRQGDRDYELLPKGLNKCIQITPAHNTFSWCI